MRLIHSFGPLIVGYPTDWLSQVLEWADARPLTSDRVALIQALLQCAIREGDLSTTCARDLVLAFFKSRHVCWLETKDVVVLLTRLLYSTPFMVVCGSVDCAVAVMRHILSHRRHRALRAVTIVCFEWVVTTHLISPASAWLQEHAWPIVPECYIRSWSRWSFVRATWVSAVVLARAVNMYHS